MPVETENTRDGLVYDEDAFGATKLVDWNKDEWETVFEVPAKIEWDKTDSIDVILEQIKEIQLPDEDGELKNANILLLRDVLTNELKSCFQDYNLGEAKLEVGHRYVIQRTGQQSIGGGRKLNEYRVLRRKA